MTDAACRGPLCTFTGGPRDSHAFHGRCTDTGGYISNAEIDEILSYPDRYSTVEDYYDESSDSNILVYGDDSGSDWVAYMDGDVKSKRIEFIRSINIAGVADWAVDLESFTGDYPEEDSDPDDPEIDVSDLEKLLCPIDMNPGSMRALLEKSDTIPSICRAQFAAKILHQDLDDAVTKYAEAATGFDDLFGYYADWLKDSINSRLEDFMSFEDGKGNKYFKCHWRYGIVDDSGPCTGMPQFWKDLISYTVTYELQDERGFFDALEEELGIEKDWVRFGIQQSPPGCDTTGDDYWLPGAPIRHCRRIYQTRVGFPMRVDKDRINVGNPKALIEAAMPNITMLQISSLAAYGELVMSCYDLTNPENTNTDVVVAMSMPVYQLQEAVDNMKEIKSIGEKARDAKKKDLILMILGIVLLILPFAGELLGPVVGSATQVARLALLISEAGNAALTIADIIKDPASAPFAILGLLVGAAGTGKVSRSDTFHKAFKIREALDSSKLAKFSHSFREKDAIVQKLVKSCKK